MSSTTDASNPAEPAAPTPPVTLAQLLDRREQRQGDQVRLLRATGCPVVSLTIVSPGPIKDDADARFSATLAARAVEGVIRAKGWAILGCHGVQAPTGPEFLYAVAAAPTTLKRAMVDLEDTHPLGRLWDIDVVAGPGPGGLPIVLDRAAIGHGRRRCLVCGDCAVSCARSRRHPLPELSGARGALVHAARERCAADAASLAVEALLVEARLTPKPGLVDRVTRGAHRDMDLDLLQRSAAALAPWFGRYYWAGAGRPGDVGPLLELGRQAESAMQAAMLGVNTHRGANFALGLLMGAMGADDAGAPPPSGVESAVPHASPRVERLCRRVADLARPLLQAWQAADAPESAHGAIAYRQYGVTGARGEAASGFATAASVGLPAYRQRLAAYGDRDDALRWALVRLMAVNPDTNLLFRGGPEGLQFVRDWASSVAVRHPDLAALSEEMAGADVEFTRRWLSPGGSADLLAVTWLLDRVSEP